MTKKILAIDGGGIKGVFPAAFLAGIEEQVGGPLNEYFDLIVGTSTGGIIALALGMGVPIKDVVGFYKEHGPKIFGGNRILRKARQLVFPKYGQDNLRAALEGTFGARRLGESTTRLVIPCQNLETGDVHVFKTAHHDRFKNDYKVQAVDVALATSAAPTYFPGHRMPSGTVLIDGGMWANNPSGMAVVEALGVLGWSSQSLRVLSVACVSQPTDTGGHRGSRGAFYWASLPKLRVTEMMMRAQSSASYGTALLLAGGKDNVIRIDPIVDRGKFDLDKISAINDLAGLGAERARYDFPSIKHLFDAKAEKFEPIYQLND